ncbi:MAG: hypothetical protein AB8B81_10885 [Halioglobus sp.]
MHKILFLIATTTVATTAEASLPEPLYSYKNTYISCVNTVVAQTLEAGNEVSEPLLRTACMQELATLRAVVPEGMTSFFFDQLREEVKSNVYRQVAPPSQ